MCPTRRRAVRAGFAAAVLLAAAAGAPGGGPIGFGPRLRAAAEGPAYVPGQLLVKFKPSAPAYSRALAIVSTGSRALGRIPGLGVYLLETPPGRGVEEMAGVFGSFPDVDYAEPNLYCRALVTPNDTFFKYQYALSNKGGPLGLPGSPSGKASADIKAAEAWEETRGSEDTVIAIVDSGIDRTHPDLAAKLAGPGRDFINNDLDATDDFGHGTMVAGLAAADTNNNEGIAGVAWNARLLPVKVLDAAGDGPVSAVSDGIRWASDNGAHVVNLSLGSPAPSQTLRDAVKYAFDRGAVVVAAAGNDGGAVWYPAAYDDYCFAVAATDYADKRADFSGVGTSLDAAAPGVAVLSTYPVPLTEAGGLPYRFGDGTSFAAPHASGLAALVRGLKPWLSAAEIMTVLRFSAADVNADTLPGRDEFLGYGRIDMAKALVPLAVRRGPGRTGGG